MSKRKIDKAALKEVLTSHPEVEWILASAHNESLTPEGDFLDLFYEKYKPWLSHYAGWSDESNKTAQDTHYDALYETIVDILERKQKALDKAYAKAKALGATEPIISYD